MDNIKNALKDLNRNMASGDQSKILSFYNFLDFLAKNPKKAIRDIFQVFYDMRMSILMIPNQSILSTMISVNFWLKIRITPFLLTGSLPTGWLSWFPY